MFLSKRRTQYLEYVERYSEDKDLVKDDLESKKILKDIKKDINRTL